MDVAADGVDIPVFTYKIGPTCPTSSYLGEKTIVASPVKETARCGVRALNLATC